MGRRVRRRRKRGNGEEERGSGKRRWKVRRRRKGGRGMWGGSTGGWMFPFLFFIKCSKSISSGVFFFPSEPWREAKTLLPYVKRPTTSLETLEERSDLKLKLPPQQRRNSWLKTLNSNTPVRFPQMFWAQNTKSVLRPFYFIHIKHCFPL